MRKLLLVALAALPLVALGCKVPNLQDRQNDAAQIFRLNIGVGPGFLANVQATRALGLGLGMYESRRFGFRDGHGWIWDERRYDMNLIVPIWGWEDVEDTLRGGMPVTNVWGDQAEPLPPGTERGLRRWRSMPLTINDHNRGWFEISANLHLIWVGADVGVDFGELVDWVGGYFSWDPARDDQHTGKKLQKHNPQPTPRPREPLIELLH